MQDVAEENVIVARSYEDALEKLDKMGDKLEIIWNIGGHDVYKLGLESPRLEKVNLQKNLSCLRYFVSCDSFSHI